MSCSCNQPIITSPTGECLPTVEDANILSNGSVLCSICPDDEECLHNDASDGTTLDTTWLDSCCAKSGVTLLGRIGNKLTRLIGTGYLKIDSGKVSVSSSIPLKITTMWHRWWRPAGSSAPVLGEPLDAPFMVVGDNYRNMHAIRGLTGKDSIILWDSTNKAYIQISLEDLAARIARLYAGGIS